MTDDIQFSVIFQGLCFGYSHILNIKSKFSSIDVSDDVASSLTKQYLNFL